MQRQLIKRDSSSAFGGFRMTKDPLTAINLSAKANKGLLARIPI
jgi:hypothetical protein